MILDAPIATDRLVLRPLTAADADGPYAAWMEDAEILRWLDVRFGPRDRAALTEFIETANAAPNVLLLAIVTRDDDRHIGNIKLTVTERHRRADIGIIIGEKSHWGRGFAREAIEAIVEQARALGVERLFAGCVGPNLGSVGAFLKAGFEREGVQRAHWFDGETRHDVIMLGKVLAQ